MRSVLPCAWARLSLASFKNTRLPRRRSALSGSLCTSGTIPPSISAITAATPGDVDQAGSASSSATNAPAWRSVIRRIVLADRSGIM